MCKSHNRKEWTFYNKIALIHAPQKGENNVDEVE